MTTKEYVVCVVNPPADGCVSYCGRDLVGEFCFIDASHAVNNAWHQGRLLICPDCAKEIVDLIDSQIWRSDDNSSD